MASSFLPTRRARIFFLARIRIEIPAAIFFYDRDRIRPVFGAYIEDHHTIAFFRDTMHLVIFRNKVIAIYPILGSIA